MCRWVRRSKLPDALCNKLPGVVAATIEVYNTIRAELLPTPAKSHYLYNMRDLSKLFQVGVLGWGGGEMRCWRLLQASTLKVRAKANRLFDVLRVLTTMSQGMQSVGVPVQDTSSLMRLWGHEAMRVFHDRLVDDADRGWFCALLAQMLPKHTDVAFEDVFAVNPDMPPSPVSPTRKAAAVADNSAGADAAAAKLTEQTAATAALRGVIFADFLQAGSGADNAKYQEASEFNKLLKRVEDSLVEYNEQVGVSVSTERALGCCFSF